MNRKKKKQIGWIIAMVLIISMMAVTAAGCGAKKDKGETASSAGSAAVTVPSEGELSKADLKTLEELKLVSGIRDYTIEADTKLKMSDLISFNKDYISKVEIKEDQADYSKPGQYKLKYLLSMDIKKIQKLAKEKGKAFSFSEDKGKKAFITFTNTVLKKGDPAIAENKDVITEETVKTVIASNEAWVVPQEGSAAGGKNIAGQSASQKTPEQKPSGGNAGNTASNNNQNVQQNNNNPGTNNSNNNPGTNNNPGAGTTPQNPAPAATPEPVTEYIPPHQHSFDIVISETPAQCYYDGSIVRQCACGETYTETTPALGHDWEYVPHYDPMGKWVVEEGQAWEDGHWEMTEVGDYRCRRCGGSSPTPY